MPALLAIAEIVANPEQHGVTLQPIANEPYFSRIATGGQIDLDKAANLAGIDAAEMKRLNPGFKRWATDPDGPHSVLIPVDRSEQFTAAIDQLPKEQRLTWHQHRIRRGETLGQIAHRYGTTVTVLQRTNKIRGHLIREGRHLLIPAPGAENDRPPAIAARDSGGSSIPANTAAMHTVNRGDSLWTISRRYGTSVADLTAVNNINSNVVLRPGQKLRLPERQTTATDQSRRLVNYTVRRGDSLWTISRRFQVPLASLREWNSLHHKTLLQPGQELQVYLSGSEPHGI
ncbi:MAG: LysM peptidoglycan-binding domain-containing protein [Gammaproteobacteria bacterium]|nr:LysM peptidoglycan-binding domain-containing protein [Gammaproteobacteria bacterium]